jgi:acetyl-CoA carboxylase biotin carboxyl carrier protein
MNIKDVKQLGARLSNGGKSKATMAIDSGAVRELADLLAETGLTEIEVEHNGQRIRVSRQAVSRDPCRRPCAECGTGCAERSCDRRATAETRRPFCGHRHLAHGRHGLCFAGAYGKPPFVKVGDVVKEGDTLLIVEAMKTMNPILAPRGGTISEICITTRNRSNSARRCSS